MLNDLAELVTVLPKYFELRRSASTDRKALEALKRKKLIALVRKVYEDSPYYRSIIERNNIDLNNPDISKFPVLTKTALMESFDAIVTDRNVTHKRLREFCLSSRDPRELFMGKYQVVYSSGSSSEPGFFMYTRDEWLRGMAQTARFKPLSKLLSPKRYAYCAVTEGHFMGISGVKAGFRATAKNNISVAYDARGSIFDVIENLNQFQPNTLGGYTTALVRLAKEQKKGALHIKPQWIEAMGESVDQDTLMYLQQAFGCEVYNLYGSSEHQLMGIQGPRSTDLTLYDDDVIYEFEKDRTITTNLLNHTLPLIRYEMTDIMKPLGVSAGTPYLRVESVIGRKSTSAIFLNENGREDFISSPNLSRKLTNVLRVQMRQTSAEAFKLMVCPKACLSPADIELVLSNTKSWLNEVLTLKKMRNLNYSIVLCDSIPLDPVSKKFQVIVKEVSD